MVLWYPFAAMKTCWTAGLAEENTKYVVVWIVVRSGEGNPELSVLEREA